MRAKELRLAEAAFAIEPALAATLRNDIEGAMRETVETQI
jgi:hypothetical protein